MKKFLSKRNWLPLRIIMLVLLAVIIITVVVMAMTAGNEGVPSAPGPIGSTPTDKPLTEA